jgi:hypothetical protein
VRLDGVKRSRRSGSAQPPRYTGRGSASALQRRGRAQGDQVTGDGRGGASPRTIATASQGMGGRGRGFKAEEVMSWAELAWACIKFVIAFSPIIFLVFFFGAAHKNDKRLNAKKKKYDFVETSGNDDRNAALSQFGGFGAAGGASTGLSHM